MKTISTSIIAIAATAFTASVALAQQQGEPSMGGQGGAATGATKGSPQSGAPMQQGEATGRPLAMTQAKLREALQQAGFSEIRILDAAYLVHAKTQDGDVVVLTINPPSMAALSGQTGGATTGSGAGSGQQQQQDGTKQKQ